jgi:hypothetical protein
MGIAWRLLKEDDDTPDISNFGSPYDPDTRLPELSMDDLFRLLNHPNERIAHKADEEMQMRSMDTEGSNLPYDPMNTSAGEVAAFYEPQFQDLDYEYGNIQPEGMDGEYNKEGIDEEYSQERAGDVDEAMPGDIEQFPSLAAKYQHLKDTAPLEVSQQFADRIKNYFESNTQPIKIPELGLDIPPAYVPELPKGNLYTPDEIMSEGDKMNEALSMYPGPTATTGFDDKWQNKLASEPIDIAFQLLKERVSPEAIAHKLAYDKKYESTPERVKYREDLNRERRQRHIMGHGGPDMSHTKDHTIVPEDPHTNRARHFKETGTLL